MRITTEILNKHPKSRRTLIDLKRMFGDKDIEYTDYLIYLLKIRLPHQIEREMHNNFTIEREWEHRLIGVISYNYLPKIQDIVRILKDNSATFGFFVLNCLQLYVDYQFLINIKIKDVNNPFILGNKVLPIWINNLVQQLKDMRINIYGKTEEDFLFHDAGNSAVVSCQIANMKIKEFFNITPYEIRHSFNKLYATNGICFRDHNFYTTMLIFNKKRYFKTMFIGGKIRKGVIGFLNYNDPIFIHEKIKWAITMRELEIKNVI